MLTLLLPLVKKLWPYALGSVLFFGSGVYLRGHWDESQLAAAKLALVTQQKNDADALAAANAAAAQELAAESSVAASARAALQIAKSRAATDQESMSAQIEADAKNGGDGAVAPVLTDTLATLAKESTP